MTDARRRGFFLHLFIYLVIGLSLVRINRASSLSSLPTTTTTTTTTTTYYLRKLENDLRSSSARRVLEEDGDVEEDPDEKVHKDMWWLGVIMSLSASFGTVLGMTLQKIGHQKNLALPIHERKSCWRNPYTWGGLVLMTLIPAPLDVGALAFAKYSVLAPFSGFTLVLNAIVSPVCLGETVEMVDYLGSALICLGTFVTTVYGSHHSRVYTVKRLNSIYGSAKCIIYVTIMILFASFVGCALRRVFLDPELKKLALPQKNKKEKKKKNTTTKRRRPSGSKVVITNNDADESFEDQHLLSGNEIDRINNNNNNSILTCCVPRSIATKFAKDALVWLAFLNGLFGSTQQVLVKSVIELFKVTADGRNQMRYALPYLLGFFALLFGAVQFRILNYGLEKFNQIKYVPMYSANIILTGVLSAWFLLDDAEDLDWNQILFFIGGGGITVIGILLLQVRPRTPRKMGSNNTTYSSVVEDDDDESYVTPSMTELTPRKPRSGSKGDVE